MISLLRSTFVAAANDDKQILLRNYIALVDSGLDPDIPEDQVIWNFVKDFVQKFGEVPGVNTLKSHFTTVKEDTIVDRLDQLAMVPSLSIGDFIVRLEDRNNERRIRLTKDILQDASQILAQGREIKKGHESVRLHGPIDALRWVMDQGHQVMTPTLGSRLSGEVTGDGVDFMNRYDRVESDPLAGIGQHTGLQQLDVALNGAKKFELWIHAAFTGGLKCVTGDTLIYDVARKRQRSVQELSKTGDAPIVHALDPESQQIKTYQASPVIPNGVRQIYKITTHTGREIRVSGNHPFLTPGNQWVNAENLVIGDAVGVASNMPLDKKQTSKRTLSPGEMDALIELIELNRSTMILPGDLWGYPDEVIRQFLIKFWKDQKFISYPNKKLALGVQSLAQRIGIHVRVQKSTDGNYLVITESTESLNQDDGVLWERVDDIKHDGQEMTYDLSVPGPANFVANGFITHNSTLMLNWAYNQAVFYLHDSLIFSLEMPYEQCRNILYSMHSMHTKFKEIRYHLGLQSTPDAVACIPYENIRDGTLNQYHPNAKKFIRDFVVPDFNGTSVITGKDPMTGQPWTDPKNYGKIFIEVADPDKSDFTMADIRHRAEVIYSKTPFSMIFIDHVGLMAPRKWVPSTTDRLNEVIRDCKRLAMSFNRGQGIAVVALFQISREGYKVAKKAKEKTGVAEFDLTHLSYSNEAERCLVGSRTYVYTSKGCRLLKDINLGDSVLSRAGWETVTKVYNNGVRRVWRLVTDRGSILEGTGKHRVRVLLDGKLGWKELKHLTSDDYVVGAFDYLGSHGTLLDLPDLIIPQYVKHTEHPLKRNQVDLRFSVKCNTELAYLLGTWDGGGIIRAHDLFWQGHLKEKIAGEQNLRRWFQGIAGPRALGVPQVILSAPREYVVAYLQGLFDAGGWVSNKGQVGIRLNENSDEFLRQVQELLTGLGVDSRISKSTVKVVGKSCIHVILQVISRKSKQRFASQIGFTETHEQKKLLKFIDQPKQKIKDGQKYPVGQTFLSLYAKCHPPKSPMTKFSRSFYNAPSKARKTGLVFRTDVETLLEYAAQVQVEGPEVDFLKHILTLHVMQVKSVIDTGIDEPVMDLEVTGDHEYLTGPVFSHNSGDIVTATWVDDDLRSANRVQFQCLKSRDQKPFERFESRVEWPCRRLLTCLDVSMKPTPMGQRSGVGTPPPDAIEDAARVLD